MKTSVILLAGGKGLRMGRPDPKQFIFLNNKPLCHYSLELFLKLEEVAEIIVVCSPEYRHFFSLYPVVFAPPGNERVDSVYNGLQMVSKHIEWVTIHDSVRPFLTENLVKKLLEVGRSTGAAALALPAKNTLKHVCEKQFVKQTVDRSVIWEIQTPQLLRKEILETGFLHEGQHGLHVTDDVSLAELIGHPVKLILGCYKNIKITTPEDLDFATWLMQKNTE